MQYNDMTFGQRLKRKLSEKNMTQKQLSILLKLSEPAVSKYFRDESEPDHATTIKIAELLDTTVQYLLTGKKILPTQLIDSDLAEMLREPKLRSVYKKIGQLNENNFELASDHLDLILKKQNKEKN